MRRWRRNQDSHHWGDMVLFYSCVCVFGRSRYGFNANQSRTQRFNHERTFFSFLELGFWRGFCIHPFIYVPLDIAVYISLRQKFILVGGFYFCTAGGQCEMPRHGEISERARVFTSSSSSLGCFARCSHGPTWSTASHRRPDRLLLTKGWKRPIDSSKYWLIPAKQSPQGCVHACVRVSNQKMISEDDRRWCNRGEAPPSTPPPKDLHCSRALARR